MPGTNGKIIQADRRDRLGWLGVGGLDGNVVGGSENSGKYCFELAASEVGGCSMVCIFFAELALSEPLQVCRVDRSTGR